MNAAALLRKDRLLFLDYVTVLAAKLSHRVQGGGTSFVRLKEALQHARSEMERK